MKRLRTWYFRWLVLQCRLYRCSVVPTETVEEAAQAAARIQVTCRKSDFLRDGRYPGGRHAERKIRRELPKLTNTMLLGMRADV